MSLPVETGDWSPPENPLFWVEEDSREIKIAWNSVSDASTYKVYRSADNVAFSEIASVTAPTVFYLDTGSVDTDYYYKVTALDASNNESDANGVNGKRATPKEIVIDDDAMEADLNANGTISKTGSWGVYHTGMAGYAQQVLQNAVGGDDFSGPISGTGQTFTWTTNTTLNGNYDIYVTYICDPSRGVARYDVYSGVNKLTGTPISIYQSRADGLLASAPCAAQSTSSEVGPVWVKIGNFPIAGQSAAVTLTDASGERYIIADAVAFKRTGDISIDTPVNEGWNLQTQSTTPNEKPLDLLCGATTNGGDPAHPRVAQNWTAATQTGVKYQREVTYPSGSVGSNFYETNNYTPFSSFGPDAGIEGLWKTRVRAFIDVNGNGTADTGADIISPWSNYCNITLDRTAPITTATVTNSPVRPVEERIVNGDFETGNFNGWTKGADTAAVVIGADAYTSPNHGSYMAKIGATGGHDDPLTANPINVNIVSQAIPKGVRSVGFYYNFFTRDSNLFDEPGMMVYVNDKQVQQIWASDINVSNDDSGRAYTSGWQHMNIYIGDVEDATLTIAFYSGNTPTTDTSMQSWLYLDDVSTLDLVANGEALFELHPEDESNTTTYYQLGTGAPVQTGTAFTLNSKPVDGVVRYWSSDAAGNEEIPHVFYVAYDVTKPAAIDNLEAVDEGEGEFSLSFTAPSDNLFPAVNEYDIRYSTSIIDATTNWNSLSKPSKIVDDGLPGTDRAPRYAGEPETIVLAGLDEGEHYYFAIKSADAAKNWSDLSNVAEVNNEAAISGVVLNEILYNPVGDDSGSMPNGEWVELYNNSTADIDVNGWYITNSVASTLTISASNSDNNLNLSDGGETVVPAGGRLVVYQSGSELMNNGGDTITLYNAVNSLIDTRTYTSGKAEGLSEARIPDGVGTWVDPIATPGTPNAVIVNDLIPQVKVWQQDAHNAKFTLFDTQGYDTAEYALMYTHQVDGTDVREAITDSVSIGGQSRLTVGDLYLGTCSEGGACTPHTGITLVSIEVELSRAVGTTNTKILTYELPGAWNEPTELN